MFKNMNFLKVTIATVITRIGDSIDSIALSWLVYVLTGSKLLMGTLFAVSFIPNLLILPFSGVIADVVSKKKLTFMSDIFRGLSVSCLALVYYFNLLEVWHLFLFVVINSVFESLADPARSTLLPLIVKEDEYVSANGYLSTASTLGNLIGIGLAGAIIGFFGIWVAILIDGITFFVSGVLILSMKIKEINNKKLQLSQINEYLNMIKEGFKFVKNDHLILSFVLFGAILNFSFVPFNVLNPVYVDQVMKTGAIGMSYLGGALLFGMLAGGILIGNIGKKVKPIKTAVISFAILGLCYSLLGVINYISIAQSAKIVVIIIISFFFGMMLPIAQAPIIAMIMKRIPSDIIGRVISIFTLISLSTNPLGGTIVGAIGDNLSVSQLFMMMGVFGILGSFAFMIYHRNTVLEPSMTEEKTA
ncbi:MAG: MFS transporter [Clostridiales bacterium]|nr:MFS transporter [Clostridiales bacterium]